MKCCSRITCLVLTLFASAVLSKSDECGLINTAQFDSHEKFTQIDEFPWMARILYNETDTLANPFECQAVLINQQYLITLANCVVGTRSQPYAVLLGDWNTTNSVSEKDCDNANEKCTTPLLIEIAEMIVHPSYESPDVNNDIALLRLAEAVTFTDYIRPICLPSKDVQDKDFAAKELILTGWLRFEKVDGRKRKLRVVGFNQHDCRKKFADEIIYIGDIDITKSLMCAVTSKGDEEIYFSTGSALMDVRDESPTTRSVYLVGIAPFSTVGSVKGVPDIFVRIDQLLDWIKEIVH